MMMEMYAENLLLLSSRHWLMRKLRTLQKSAKSRAPEPTIRILSFSFLLFFFPLTALPFYSLPLSLSLSLSPSSYAKRGQVLLAEYLTSTEAPGTSKKFVSVHPGWVNTPAVDAAYGSQKKWLEPMRGTWQGAEGISWLLTARPEEVESGEFYLDRTPQVKHMGGRTKNTPEDAEEMMVKLKEVAGL